MMTTSRTYKAVALWLALVLAVTDAFSSLPTFGVVQRTIRASPSHNTRLFSEANDASGGGSGEPGDAAAATDEQSVEEEQPPPSQSEEQEAEPPEDPQVMALKQEIANLESSLKAKQRELDYANDQADMYSKAGYARKVAEMETMRRMRSSMNSSNRESSVASVLQSFLPIVDQLNALRDTYQNDEFGSKYNAFASDMNGAFKGLGVQEYTLTPGEAITAERATVVEEVHSSEFAKGTVLRPVRMGLELQGNVIRPAECVASLGSQEQEEKEEAEQQAQQGEGEAAAEAEEIEQGGDEQASQEGSSEA